MLSPYAKAAFDQGTFPHHALSNVDRLRHLLASATRLIALMLLIAPSCSGALKLEAGGVQLVLPKGWSPLIQPTNFFVQQRAANEERGMTVGIGAIEAPISVEQYVALGSASMMTGPNKQWERISKLSGISVNEIQELLGSIIGKQLLEQLKASFESTQFEFLGSKSYRQGEHTMYETRVKATFAEPAGTAYIRALVLHGAGPNQIVQVSFAGLTSGLFEDETLLEAIYRPQEPVLGSKLNGRDRAALTQLGQRLTAAALTSDRQAFLDLMHPDMVNAMGGPDKVLEALKSEEEKNQAAGVVVSSFNFSLDERVHSSKRGYVTFIKTDTAIFVAGTRWRYKSFQVAFAPDRNGRWYIFEGAKLTLPQFQKMFPGLPADLKLPLVEKTQQL